MKSMWRCRHIGFLFPLIVTFALLYLLIQPEEGEHISSSSLKRDLKVVRDISFNTTTVSSEDVKENVPYELSVPSHKSTLSKTARGFEKPLDSMEPQKPSTHSLKKKERVKSNMIAAAVDKNSPDFKSVMEYNKNFSPHITQDLFVEGYAEAHPELCAEDDDILLSILIISSPSHLKQREAIRATWGRQGLEGTGLVVGFMVGQSEEEDTRVKVQEESILHGDVIINKMSDLYENLSLKTLSAFSWILKFCPQTKFILKVDDDMFVQVERLLTLVRELENDSTRKKVILGNISRGWKPVRNPESKYFISPAQYDGEKYPAFATGPSYLLSKEAVKPICEAALDHKYIHLEDVFLTGVVAEEVGVVREDQAMFKNNANRVPARFMGCTINHTITIHKVGPEEQEELYTIAKDGANCGPRAGSPGVRKKMDKRMKQSLDQWWKKRKETMQQMP